MIINIVPKSSKQIIFRLGFTSEMPKNNGFA